MKKIVLCLIGLLLLVSCSKNTTDSIASYNMISVDISVHDPYTSFVTYNDAQVQSFQSEVEAILESQEFTEITTDILNSVSKFYYITFADSDNNLYQVTITNQYFKYESSYYRGELVSALYSKLALLENG